MEHHNHGNEVSQSSKTPQLPPSNSDQRDKREEPDNTHCLPDARSTIPHDGNDADMRSCSTTYWTSCAARFSVTPASRGKMIVHGCTPTRQRSCKGNHT